MKRRIVRFLSDDEDGDEQSTGNNECRKVVFHIALAFLLAELNG